MYVALSWLKKNAATMLLVVAAVLILLLAILGFWFKIRGFKIADLLYQLQILEAKNEQNHLQVKKAVLEEKGNEAEKDIKEIDKQIQEEQKKIETARMKYKGKSNEEIASELTNLGF